MTHQLPARRILGTAALVAACLAWAWPASAQIEGAFERTLKVSGPVTLTITSGSGRIRVSPGPADTVRISARLRASNSWFPGNVRERIREIEKNPPIQQTGNAVRVGEFADWERARNIGISYEVTVPTETSVKARTGSGGIEVGDLRGSVEADTGSGGISIGRTTGPVAASTGSGGIDVAGAASLTARSGSGSITATGIGGTVRARSGSGGVRVEHAGKGDVDVSSSSGEVVVTGVDGAARVSASSGGIVVEGRPSGPWDVHASSGGVRLRIPPDAAFDLDAHVSSGRIDSSHPITVQGSVDRRSLRGKVRGGGALVAVRSSSGGIRIE